MKEFHFDHVLFDKKSNIVSIWILRDRNWRTTTLLVRLISPCFNSYIENSSLVLVKYTEKASNSKSPEIQEITSKSTKKKSRVWGEIGYLKTNSLCFALLLLLQFHLYRQTIYSNRHQHIHSHEQYNAANYLI